MKKQTWPVHAAAECNDCGWTASNWKNAAATAAIHAKAFNHFVRVETVLVSYYNEDHSSNETKKRTGE